MESVTPPGITATCRCANFRKNSLHIVVPHGAHGLGGLDGLDCVERLTTRFVEEGTTKGLDTACVKNIRRRGFVLN